MKHRITLNGLFNIMEGMGFQKGNGARDERVINHENIISMIG